MIIINNTKIKTKTYLSQEEKEIIDMAYYACMNNTATTEQKLIWQFANAINCVDTSLMLNDMKKAKSILAKNNYIN